LAGRTARSNPAFCFNLCGMAYWPIIATSGTFRWFFYDLTASVEHLDITDHFLFIL
jgi:hypothetical protein